MKKNKKVPENFDEYVCNFPKDVQLSLKKLRATIKKAAPKAEEGISYGMPAFKFHGPLVYFAAAKKHIGLYPTPTPIVAFKNELAKYETAQGTIKLPLDKPIPLALITKIVKFRVKENLRTLSERNTPPLKNK